MINVKGGVVALGAVVCCVLLALYPVRDAVGNPAPAPKGFDPTSCGERHQRLFSGDFEQFWTYVELHGWNGVSEFAWSVPQGANESDANWRERARQCFLEVERRNPAKGDPKKLYTLGYFLWHGGVAFGFDREANKRPGVRERGYRMLLTSRKKGFDKAFEALIGVHYDMIRAIDTAALRGKQGARPSEGPVGARVPEWWPKAERLLQDLETTGAKGYGGAYLSLATIYRERWLTSKYFGIDHLGHVVDAPDPALKVAFERYDGLYRATLERQNGVIGVGSPRPPNDIGH